MFRSTGLDWLAIKIMEQCIVRELELMGTVGCHLCDVAEQLIVNCVDMQAFAVYQVDIADEDALVERLWR